MDLVKPATFAKMCGVSRTTVLRWTSSGSLVLQGKLIDVDASRQKMERFHAGGSPLKNRGVTNEVTNEILSPETVTLVTQPVDEDGETDAHAPHPDLEIRPGESPEQAAVRVVAALNADMDFEEARRVKENYLALKAQLEYDRDSALVVLVEDVAKVVGAQLANVRTRLRAIGPEHGAQLSRLKTPREASAYLSEAIDDALRELTADHPDVRWEDPSRLQVRSSGPQ